MDKIHFIFACDNNHILDVVDSQSVKNVVVVSNGEAMTMVVWITSQKKTHIKSSMLNFVNKSCNKRGPPDNVVRVCY